MMYVTTEKRGFFLAKPFCNHVIYHDLPVDSWRMAKLSSLITKNGTGDLHIDVSLQEATGFFLFSCGKANSD